MKVEQLPTAEAFFMSLSPRGTGDGPLIPVAEALRGAIARWLRQFGRRKGTILLLATCSASPLYGQDDMLIGCRQCEATATLVLRIGSESGPGALADPARIVQRQNGQWVVTDFQDSGRIKVFSPQGDVVGTVGQSGEGPGEYLTAFWAIVGDSDSLRVVDLGQQRITTLSPTLETVRTQRLGGMIREIVFLEGDQGRYVVSATVSSRSSIGLPLHLVSHAGEVIRSFGARDPILDFRNEEKIWRLLAVTPSGHLWTGRRLSYQLERWSLETGDRLDVLARNAPWFPPQEEARLSTDPGDVPTPSFVGMAADTAGNLWTASYVADDDWSSAIVDGRDPYGNPAKTLDDLSQYFDSVIEIISPEQRTVLGRITLDGTFLGFPSDGLVATRIIQPPGYPVIKIWRVEPPPRTPFH